MGHTSSGQLEWSAPGPGSWALDRSHFIGATTPITQWLMESSMSAGMERVLEEIGAPIRSVDARFVNGFMYTRPRPLLRPDRPATRLPPTPLLKLAAHLHPTFRRRARTAARTLEERPALTVAREWDERIRPRLIERNRELQSIDPAGLDDLALDGHVGDLLDHAREQAELHFWLHGHDLGPIARFLHRCESWGLDPADATRALAGASPTTSRPTSMLYRLRQLLDEAGVHPATLDDVRSASPEAEQLLDDYLADRAHVLATGYDLTAFTLAELPNLVVESIRSAAEPATPSDTESAAIAAELQAQVPGEGRDEFDVVLHDARAVMDMRDDNGPLTVEWPMGLLRRSLLEVGRRLVERAGWHDPTLAIEVTPDEARTLLGGPTPTAAELDRRAERRSAHGRLEPPNSLGADEPEPPPTILPAPLPELVGMIQTSFRHLGMDAAPRSDSLVGVGIGDAPYTGRVRRAGSADEALDAMEPGDVLVVRATSPAFNVVLTIAGAIVTADGGAMSHAAVLARELGIPAVIGAGGALDLPDGATVEVDPAAGRVRQLDDT
ncbi:MAG: PEP-utilizing enzyme [Actinomycetota bacterium]